MDCVGDYAMTNCFHQNTVLMKTAHESKCLNFGEVMTIALKKYNRFQNVVHAYNSDISKCQMNALRECQNVC